jgi:hypothetical protein
VGKNGSQGRKKPGTAKNPGQQFIQNTGTIYPLFIHYLTPSAPTETGEVTIHTVLIIGLSICRGCFQRVSIFYLLSEVSEWCIFAKYQHFITNRK